jgi:hypothetical protein
MGDWLGTEKIANQKRIFYSYEESKNIVIKLKLKNFEEWMEFCKNEKTDDNIPTNPNVVYKNKGWISIKDWLGVDSI